MSSDVATSTSSASARPTASPVTTGSANALALGISLAVLATLVLGGLGLYCVRRRYRIKKERARVEELTSHRRTYMVSVDPTHLAARVTPFGVGVNAPDVEVPKFGECAMSSFQVGRGYGALGLCRDGWMGQNISGASVHYTCDGAVECLPSPSCSHLAPWPYA